MEGRSGYGNILRFHICGSTYKPQRRTKYIFSFASQVESRISDNAHLALIQVHVRWREVCCFAWNPLGLSARSTPASPGGNRKSYVVVLSSRIAYSSRSRGGALRNSAETEDALTAR